MGYFLTLILGSMVQAAQFAPLDVPSEHWAYPAVNEMFKQGLLRGYPPEQSRPLRLRTDVVWDADLAAKMFRELYLRGVGLGPGPDGQWKHRDPRGRLSQAAHSYSIAAVQLSVSERLVKGEIPPWVRRDLSSLADDLDEIAYLISMFQKDLRELGVDPDKMVQNLETFRQGLTVRFRG